MESSGRDLLVDMVVDRFILKNNPITLSVHTQSRCGARTGDCFYCVFNILLQL